MTHVKECIPVGAKIIWYTCEETKELKYIQIRASSKSNKYKNWLERVPGKVLAVQTRKSIKFAETETNINDEINIKRINDSCWEILSH